MRGIQLQHFVASENKPVTNGTQRARNRMIMNRDQLEVEEIRQLSQTPPTLEIVQLLVQMNDQLLFAPDN